MPAMPDYFPPLADMRFALEAVAAIGRIAALPAHEGLLELIDPVLEAAAEFASAELAPLNQIGDRVGAKLVGDQVTTPPGFKEAYLAYAAAGWNAVPFDPEYGGQGLPWALGFAIGEMWAVGQHGVRPVPAAEPGGDRGFGAAWRAGTEEALS